MGQTRDLFPVDLPIFGRRFRRYACQTMTNPFFSELEWASELASAPVWVQELEAVRALVWRQALASVSLPLRAKVSAARRATLAESETEQRLGSVWEQASDSEQSPSVACSSGKDRAAVFAPSAHQTPGQNPKWNSMRNRLKAIGSAKRVIESYGWQKVPNNAPFNL